jgi:hypothetical protein
MAWPLSGSIAHTVGRTIISSVQVIVAGARGRDRAGLEILRQMRFRESAEDS